MYISRVPTAPAPLLSPPDDVAAEVEVDEALLRRLLVAQASALADEPLERFAEGWDNVLFRIGTRSIARLPRRAIAAPQVEHEARWLPELARSLPLRLPVPQQLGRPGEGFPFPWTISPFIEGTPLAGCVLEPERVAAELGGFLAALHRLEAPADAPTSAVRGVSPRERSKALLAKLGAERVRSRVDTRSLEALWRSLVAAPDWDANPVWCHGDFHPFNLLARDGGVAAVLDWGDLHGREPAPDLACIWMALPVSAHAAFRSAYGPIDDATWQRAKAWGLYFGVMFLDAGAGGAGDGATRLGEDTLARVLA